jgi:hypothetical protein
MPVEISPREARVLVEALPTYLKNPRSEIHRTENPSYKRELREPEEILQRFVERVQAPLSSATVH